MGCITGFAFLAVGGILMFFLKDQPLQIGPIGLALLLIGIGLFLIFGGGLPSLPKKGPEDAAKEALHVMHGVQSFLEKKAKEKEAEEAHPGDWAILSPDRKTMRVKNSKGKVEEVPTPKWMR